MIHDKNWILNIFFKRYEFTKIIPALTDFACNPTPVRSGSSAPCSTPIASLTEGELPLPQSWTYQGQEKI